MHLRILFVLLAVAVTTTVYGQQSEPADIKDECNKMCGWFFADNDPICSVSEDDGKSLLDFKSSCHLREYNCLNPTKLYKEIPKEECDKIKEQNKPTTTKPKPATTPKPTATATQQPPRRGGLLGLGLLGIL